MRLISLFAGIGGFDAGFEQQGFRTVGQVEIDPHAQSVLRRHWPDVPKHDDITTAKGMMFGPAEVVTFGSPCQDLSVAGKRAGLSGERSGLFLEAMRFIREMREGTDNEYPKFAIWENVPGAYSSHGGRDFAAVLTELAKLGALDIAWRTLDSRYFGVAQRRRRIFLVADFAGERASKILFEPDSVQRHPQTGRETGQDVAACLTTGTGMRYDAETENLIPVAANVYGGNKRADRPHGGFYVELPAHESKTLDVSGLNPTAQQGGTLVATLEPLAFDAKASASRSMNPSKLSPTLEAQDKAAVAYAIRTGHTGANGSNISKDIAPTLEAAGPDAVCFQQNQRDEVRLIGGDGQVAGALPAEPGMKQQNYVAFSPSQQSMAHSAEVAPPIGASDGGGNQGVVACYDDPRRYDTRFHGGGEHGDLHPTLETRNPKQFITTPYAVRRLTPTECERLQAFPDGHTALNDEGKEIADTHRYRMLGNAVTVSVCAWLAQRVYEGLTA